MPHTENPQDREQRIQQMGELLRQHDQTGTQITKEELTAIGYTAIEQEDGTTRYVMNENLAAKPASPTRRGTREQNPTKHAPFSRITFEVPTSGKGASQIPYEQVYMLEEKLNEAETMLSIEWRLEPVEALDPINYFFDDFNGFFHTSLSGFPGGPDIDNLPSNLLKATLPFITDEYGIDLDTFHAEYLNPDPGKLDVSQENAERLHTALTRAIARHADVEELKKVFGANLADPDPMDRYAYHFIGINDNKINQIIDFFAARHITTNADFVRFALPLYLTHLGLGEMANVIQNATDLTAISTRLNQIKIPASDREKEIGERLRQLGKPQTAQLQESRDLNQERKKLVKQRKHVEKIRRGVIDYFDIPTLYAQIAKKSIEDVQDFLERGPDVNGPVQITLDPTPNAQLDANPGSISGDCTEDKPLPFYRGDTHNVKVFNGNKHIGNMYLLETTNYDDQKVWHLDAIQVPLANINARVLVQTLIEQLGQQAQANDITAITVNGDVKEHISNYDYIQDAVMGFWGQTQRERMDVVIPNVDDEEDTISNFQGDGDEALVIWHRA